MRHEVLAGDGVRLAVAEDGDPDAPVVLCVHGYPDNRSVWDGVVAELANRHRVVRYDVRGAGESGAPAGRGGYRLDRLASDLAAVVDAASQDRPVHLLAHDWGAIQAWHALTRGWLRSRVASYTSISGPCLDHAGAWLRANLRSRAGLTQLLHSGYIAFFQLPLLPELAWRSGLGTRLARRLDRTAPAPVLGDAVRGLALYRQNMLPRLSRPRPMPVDVPVQVLAPTLDPFVGVPMQTGISRWVPDLRVHEVPDGHWLPRSQPRLIAQEVSSMVWD